MHHGVYCHDRGQFPPRFRCTYADCGPNRRPRHSPLQDRRDEATEALREAHQRATEIGARPLLEALEALARRARIGLPGIAAIGDGELGLTRREREVLELVAQGLTNRVIGERIYIAETTASVHVSNILARLEVSNRGEAAALAHRLGLAPPG